MPKRNGQQQGPQNHAEGQHGDKTHAAFLEEQQDNTALGEESAEASHRSNDADEFGRPRSGHHRLQEDREQHDEAEKNSEANRLRR